MKNHINTALKLEETANLNATLKNFEKALNDTYKVMDEAGYSNDFIQVLKRTYTSFDFDDCKNRIDSKRWEKLIKSINYIECAEKEKLIRKYSFEYPYHNRDYSGPCYLQNAEKKIIQFEQRKQIYIDQLGKSVLDSLFKGSVRKSKYKTVDHDLTELPTKLKLMIFHELTDLHYLSNQKRASYFFENLDNFINWLYETDHGLKNLIEENWVHENLKSGQQKMEFKTKYLAIKIYKNGNCELTFSKGFLKDLNIIKNHIDNGGEIKDAQKITLFEQVISDFGLKKCRPFELGNGSKVFKFLVKRKEALLLASSKRLYVSCAGFKFKCDYDNGSFHRLIDNLRKCLIDSEAVKVNRQVKYLPEESAINVSEIGRFIDLKTILEKEYKCDLSLEPGCLNGQITIKNRKYTLSVDKILQIFSEGFEQRIDIVAKTNKQIFGYLKVVFASCQLILDESPAETKRVAPKYHNEENEAQIIPLKNSTKIENPDNSVSIIHSCEEGTYIQGDTKPVKDHLKRFGFSWSWETMFWYVRGSRNRAFCDESKKRCDDLSSFLMEKGYHVRQHYPQDAINLVN